MLFSYLDRDQNSSNPGIQTDLVEILITPKGLRGISACKVQNKLCCLGEDKVILDLQTVYVSRLVPPFYSKTPTEKTEVITKLFSLL